MEGQGGEGKTEGAGLEDVSASRPPVSCISPTSQSPSTVPTHISNTRSSVDIWAAREDTAGRTNFAFMPMCYVMFSVMWLVLL